MCICMYKKKKRKEEPWILNAPWNWLIPLELETNSIKYKKKNSFSYQTDTLWESANFEKFFFSKKIFIEMKRK